MFTLQLVDVGPYLILLAPKSPTSCTVCTCALDICSPIIVSHQTLQVFPYCCKRLYLEPPQVGKLAATKLLVVLPFRFLVIPFALPVISAPTVTPGTVPIAIPAVCHRSTQWPQGAMTAHVCVEICRNHLFGRMWQSSKLWAEANAFPTCPNKGFLSSFLGLDLFSCDLRRNQGPTSYSPTVVVCWVASGGSKYEIPMKGQNQV